MRLHVEKEDVLAWTPSYKKLLMKHNESEDIHSNIDNYDTIMEISCRFLGGNVYWLQHLSEHKHVKLII